MLEINSCVKTAATDVLCTLCTNSHSLYLPSLSFLYSMTSNILIHAATPRQVGGFGPALPWGRRLNIREGHEEEGGKGGKLNQ